MKLKMKTFIFFFIFFIPSISTAHDFWIFRSGNEVRIYGGHDFPQTEMAPGKNIAVHSYLYGKGGIKELILERGENFLFSKGIEESGLLAFSFERGEKVVYCGFYIPEEENIIKEELVKKVCGDSFSISKKIQTVKNEKEVGIEFSPDLGLSWTLYTEKGDKKTLFPDASVRISFKVKDKGLFLLLSELNGKPLSIVVGVK